MKNLAFIQNAEILEDAYRSTMINGLPKGINTGLNSLDELFRLDRGKLVVVTGIPNMGKSEFIDYLCVQYNKLHGMRTLFFSPENQPIAFHIGKLFRKLACRKDTKEDLTNEESKEMRKYIYGNFFFFDYTKEYHLKDILETARETIKELGIDILVVDSYNKVGREVSVNETELIGRELDKLERFAKEMNIILILVVHPRKMEKDRDGKYVIPSAYDMNGSANFYNKADFVLSVHRNYQPNYAIVKVDKVKFNNYGGQGMVEIGYNNVSGNYFDITNERGFLEDEDAIFTPPSETPFVLDTQYKSGEEWLNVTCACARRINTKETTEMNLYQFLTCDRPDLLKSINRIRTNTDSKERRELKTALLPIICPSVVGFNGERKTENIKGYTNLLCIDIDEKDNPNKMSSILEVLKSLPYVAFAQRSASGNGYYAIIPIEDGKYLKEYFYAVEEELAARGIIIDKGCSDFIRARYYSHDSERYVNPRCTMYTKRKSNRRSGESTQHPTLGLEHPTLVNSESFQKTLDRVCEGIESLNVCPNYTAWSQVGLALAKVLGEVGRGYFHRLSCGYKGYDKSETDSKYDDFLRDAHRYEYGTGTVLFYIREAKDNRNKEVNN